ncbi:MAG: ZIP family metal transporter [Alicyclobacillus sp.]|nr:ZIP family metal transporter [Alicyclobacillus sp.]
MTVWVLALLLSAVAACADVLGGTLVLVRRWGTTQIARITALGAGFLLGATVLDRLPDALTSLPVSGPLWVAGGYLGMMWLERYSHRAVSPVSAGSRVAGVSAAPALDGPAVHAQHVHAVAGPAIADTWGVPTAADWATLWALLIHTWLDGVVIAGAFTTSRAAGVLMFAAIALHKLPEGLSMASVALAAGRTRWRAFGATALLALSTLGGAGVTLWLGAYEQHWVQAVTALASGSFLYVSATTLIPAVKAADRQAILLVTAGAGLFMVSLWAVTAVGLH